MSKRSFLLGVAVSAAFFASYNVLATTGQEIKAFIKDDYSITVNDIPIKLPYGMRIINYIDHTYTPARLIAEAMGGSVSWDDDTKTVKITKPKPIEKIVEKIVEVPVEKSGTESNTNEQTTNPDKKIYYQSVPLKLIKGDFKINVSGISLRDNLTYIYLDIKNESSDTVMFDLENTKIKSASGQEYDLISVPSDEFSSDIGLTKEFKGGTMIFKNIGDEKEITLSIPVKSSTPGIYDETFEFNLKVD